VNGQDVKTPAKRLAVYDLFKDNDNLIVIATVHIAGTGLNIKRIFNLVTVDVGKSFIRIIQAIGRGLRIADDKDSVTVTDICSDLKYSKKHLKVRTNYYEEQKYKFKKHKIDYCGQQRSVNELGQ
jgi:superfamily II DNA or RNA helicase